MMILNGIWWVVSIFGRDSRILCTATLDAPAQISVQFQKSPCVNIQYTGFNTRETDVNKKTIQTVHVCTGRGVIKYCYKLQYCSKRMTYNEKNWGYLQTYPFQNIHGSIICLHIWGWSQLWRHSCRWGSLPEKHT